MAWAQPAVGAVSGLSMFVIRHCSQNISAKKTIVALLIPSHHFRVQFSCSTTIINASFFSFKVVYYTLFCWASCGKCVCLHCFYPVSGWEACVPLLAVLPVNCDKLFAGDSECGIQKLGCFGNQKQEIIEVHLVPRVICTETNLSNTPMLPMLPWNKKNIT